MAASARRRSKRVEESDTLVDENVLGTFPEEASDDDDSNLDLGDIIDSAVQSFFGGATSRHGAAKGKNKRRKGVTKTKLEDLVDDASDAENESASATVTAALDEIRHAFETVSATRPDAEKANMTKLKGQFPEWCLLLDEGYNLLMHGFGSKLTVLQDFISSVLEPAQCSYIEFHGYKPDAGARKLLIALAELLDLPVPANKGLLSMTSTLRMQLQSGTQHRDVVLVVHSMDGPALRDDVAQTALCQLAQCPNIRLVGSVDHLNAPLLWSQQTLSRCKFLWIDATTFLPYTHEVLSGTSKLLGLSGASGVHAHSMSSLESLWASLTVNAQRMFVLIVKAAADDQHKQGVSFWQLFRECKDEFIVSSELQLQQQLVEFCDHQLVLLKKNDSLGDRLVLTVDMQLICTFLQQQGVEDLPEISGTVMTFVNE